MGRLATEFCSTLPETTLISLALLRLPGVGAARFCKLQQQFGGSSQLIKLNQTEIDSAFKGEASSLWRQFIEAPAASTLGLQLSKDLARLVELDIAVIGCEDHNYPELLLEITNPPPLLYLRGDSRCLELPQIGIVGSRRPTPVGSDNARSFAKLLAQQGFAITSGLALGVDGAAHEGALAAKGKTLAILGTGLDQIYPSRHRRLAQEIIAAGGLLVSEYPPGTTARPGNFPQRNRIISGLSLGVLVVEAAQKSGSLITARLAAEQGREVFALPGSIHCPVSRGCNGLIRQGATLVESTEQMIEELQGLLSLKSEQLNLLPQTSQIEDKQCGDLAVEQLTGDLSDRQQSLLQQLGFDATELDILASRLNWDTGSLLAELMTLELSGYIAQQGNGYMRLNRS